FADEKLIVASNSLQAVHATPGVPHDVDELAVADYLMFGFFLDTDRTMYRRIKRLPPAHCGVLGGQLRRYWSLPAEFDGKFNDGDVVEEFRSLLKLAVKERSDCAKVALSLSGGLDSGSIAVALSDLRGG